MANFCNQCGRPLQEGEICTCQQQNVNQAQPTQAQSAQGQPNQEQVFQGQPNQGQPNQGQPYQGQPYQGQPYQGQPYQGQPYQQFQNNMGNAPFQGKANGINGNQIVDLAKNVGKAIGNLFKDPIGTTEKIAEKNEMTLPLTMVILNIAVIFLISIISMIVVRVKLGDWAEWVSIPYVKIVLVVTILSAIFDFALAGLTLLSAKVFFKDDMSFAKALSLVGTKVLIDTVVILAALILTVISSAIGIALLSVGMFFTSLMFIMSYQKVCKLSETKTFYSLFVTFVMQMAAMGIVYAVVAASVLSSLQTALGYLF
jgi:hypothetical protein